MNTKVKEFIERMGNVIVDNPKSTILGSIICTLFGVYAYRRKRKADVEAYRRKRKADAEAYEKKKKADAEADSKKRQNEVVCSVLESLGKNLCKRLDDDDVWRSLRRRSSSNDYYNDSYCTVGDDYTADVDMYRGRSSDDLFKDPTHSDGARWIVDGYMTVGLVNLLAAGAGAGKSTMMLQIALAVKKGERPEFLPPDCCKSVKLHVEYYRLEVYKGEITGKYGDDRKVPKESGIHGYWLQDLPAKTVPGFISHLKGMVEHLTEDTLVCIDPATKLDNYSHNEFIRGVEEAMEIARRRAHVQLTILASIHLDEVVNWKSINLTDIKGGDRAAQQAGSVTVLRPERRENEGYHFIKCLKEPKGYPKPFEGNVLVCKMVKKLDGEDVKYLHLQYDSIVAESKALPEKPTKRQDDENDYNSPSKPPAQKMTPEIEGIIKNGYINKLTYKGIAEDVKTQTGKEFSPEYLGKYIKNQPYYVKR